MSNSEQTLNDLASSWWLFCVRGLFSVAFGLVTFLLRDGMASVLVQPLAFVAFVGLLGLYAICNGLLQLGAGWNAREHGRRHWWLWVTEGSLGTVLGLAIFITLTASMTSLSLLAAIYAFSIGLIELGIAWRLRKHLGDEILFGAGGLLSVVAGVVFILLRNAAMEEVAGWLAAYAFVFGVIKIAYALRLRGLRNILPN